MIVLSNGYKLPETGDFGDVWFPALEDNIQQTNDHTHNGSDSEKLPETSIVAIVQTIDAGDFSAAGDEFSATVILAGGAVDIDTKHVVFRDPSTKEQIHLRYEKVTNTTVNVFTNIVETVEALLI